MESIPAGHRAEQVLNMNFVDKLPLTRALGVLWHIADHKFVFDVHMNERRRVVTKARR